MTGLPLIIPDWPAPKRVRAYSTTRQGGVSGSPYASLNLGSHVGDKRDAVNTNRQRLCQQLNLPSEPAWLEQVHSCDVATLPLSGEFTRADASIATESDQVCVVMTADCLPLLLCDREGTRVAAVHAGWRGLCDGIIERTVEMLGVAGDELLAWQGPAIGPEAFEVGPEVREAFLDHDSAAEVAFVQRDEEHWLADLYLLARMRLSDCGVTDVYGGEECTFQQERRFFSYRRDGVTGRMASLIWLEE